VLLHEDPGRKGGLVVAGEHRDPLTTKLPTAEKLDGQDFAAFRKRSAPLLAQLDRMERTMLARAP
jgi:hypothetical protein